jgi:hypothetical protein
MVRRAAYLFDASTNFEDRKKIFDSVPEFNIQLPNPAQVVLQSSSASSGACHPQAILPSRAQQQPSVFDLLAQDTAHTHPLVQTCISLA